MLEETSKDVNIKDSRSVVWSPHKDEVLKMRGPVHVSRQGKNVPFLLSEPTRVTSKRLAGPLAEGSAHLEFPRWQGKI